MSHNQRHHSHHDLLALSFAITLLGLVAVFGQQTSENPTTRRDDYVGSDECANCHGDIYAKYIRTDMGRSMLKASASALKDVPTSASLFDQHLNRHFELSAGDGELYQTEFEVSADSKEVFRETHKIDWIIGAGANGFGALVLRGNYVVEAPLSYYTNAHGWALSPGYQYADYAFTRPVLPGCIVCHSGRPQPVANGNGRFRNPPFRELAIGCENCHGPGGPHAAAASADTIVNPAKLTAWQADNICLPCHQTGDARVLRAGRDYGDIRPGTSIDDTVSIYMVPFDAKSPPQDDLLEHYVSMRLSKCYRQSGGKLSCIACHDPHTQPTSSEAPMYFRERCLTCHTDKSCSLPISERQKQHPPDNCIGCHMPKREVKVISHSVLTNHRIVRTAQEPFPDAAFHMTTPELPDLVHLSAEPGKREDAPPLMLLRAYRQVMLTHPEYRDRYWKLGRGLAAKNPDDISVLQALADASLQKKDSDGVAAAVRYLDRARTLGTTDPADFEQLGKMLAATHQETKAIEVLRQGIDAIPYDVTLYRLLAQTYASIKQIPEACGVAGRATQMFPQDDSIRSFLKQCQLAGTR